MKGLVITGAKAPGSNVCSLLAGGADLIAAADSGLETAEKAGITPDWIIGDMDSLDDTGRLDKYPKEKILKFPKDKDFTDTELALDLLWEKGCTEICIAGGGGGRLDHLLALYSLFERERYPRRWVTDSNDIHCLDSANLPSADIHPANLMVKYPLDSVVSVFPLGSGNWEAQSLGLKWPLDNVAWNRGSFGISNRTTEEEFLIRAIHGRFLIILPLY